jgi:uracil-DNA glycosylase family 4
MVTLAHPRSGEQFDSPVPPGSGWPGDPATPHTPVASTPGDVAVMAADIESIGRLDAAVSVCRACPRLVSWRERVAAEKRRSFADQPYWGRPVPGWGAVKPRMMIVGLAPAAHGGNRTGRVFTGDRSGDVLFAALHRAGLANQALCVDAADGLQLKQTRVVAAVRCAPPGNAPTPEERLTCVPWLDAEWRLAGGDVRVIVALGAFAWKAALHMVRTGDPGGRSEATGGKVGIIPIPAPKFGHGASATLRAPHGDVALIGCFHPSQQNTFTGKLTPAMLDDIFGKAKTLAGIR